MTADFKRWVTRDVLPEIRKTGTYTTTPAPALTEDVRRKRGRS